jgi:hypothetical protein
MRGGNGWKLRKVKRGAGFSIVISKFSIEMNLRFTKMATDRTTPKLDRFSLLLGGFGTLHVNTTKRIQKQTLKYHW